MVTQWEKVGIMFFGSFAHTLDEKGRLMIPRKMREELGYKVYINKGFDGSLSIYTVERYQKLVEEFNKLPFNQQRNRDYLRVQFASTYEMDVDKLGRLQLPTALLNKFNISRNVIVLGIGDHIEIWDAKKYEEYENGIFENFEKKIDGTIALAEELLGATMIEPGEYEIITNPSITGLIAHEAFGHGVEMDMFVKHRARARNYVGKQVASPLVEMHDGAAAADSVASYFFDDDGVLAHDTLIIKDGILQTGISDVISAMELGTEPTGNGRRESYKRKAYTRMTNTFFAKGTSKLEDMIKSVKHGYMLFETNNGMEDPKNWNIQCTAEYGREIKDGKFTGKIVSPVVMSGYVPDLLMSISAVSDDFEVIGAGHCGKGHKEWVPVSDGGPCLKARCKLS